MDSGHTLPFWKICLAPWFVFVHMTIFHCKQCKTQLNVWFVCSTVCLSYRTASENVFLCTCILLNSIKWIWIHFHLNPVHLPVLVPQCLNINIQFNVSCFYPIFSQLRVAKLVVLFADGDVIFSLISSTSMFRSIYTFIYVSWHLNTVINNKCCGGLPSGVVTTVFTEIRS